MNDDDILPNWAVYSFFDCEVYGDRLPKWTRRQHREYLDSSWSLPELSTENDLLLRQVRRTSRTPASPLGRRDLPSRDAPVSTVPARDGRKLAHKRLLRWRVLRRHGHAVLSVLRERAYGFSCGAGLTSRRLH